MPDFRAIIGDMKEKWLRTAAFAVGILTLSLASCAVANTMGDDPVADMTRPPTPLSSPTSYPEPDFSPIAPALTPTPDPRDFCYTPVQGVKEIKTILEGNGINLNSLSTIKPKVVVVGVDGVCSWNNTVDALMKENPFAQKGDTVCYYNGVDAVRLAELRCTSVLR